MSTNLSLTLALPVDIYHRLQSMAQSTHQPIEAIAVQSMCSNLPPSMDELWPELQTELAAWHGLTDVELWHIAQEPLPATSERRQRVLLRRNAEGKLTPVQQTELATLRELTDRFVARRSYAFALLKWRGHTLPMSATGSTHAYSAQNPRTTTPARRASRR